MQRLTALLTLAALAILLIACGDAATPSSAAEPTATTAPAATMTQPATGTRMPAMPPPSPSTAPAPTAAPQPVRNANEAAVSDAIDSILTAMHDHDHGRLHHLADTHLHAHSHDHEFQHLAACWADGAAVTVVSRDISFSGDSATAHITFSVTTATGQTSTVERVWMFVRQADGTWRLARVPACPFAS